MKRLLLLSLTIFSIVLLAEPVGACTCAHYGVPVCAQFWQTDAVFVGQVTDIQVPKGDPGSPPTATVHFIVEQPFRGISATQVDVETLHGTSCDMGFKKGERYLVYAHFNGDAKQLFAGPCSGTELLEYADDDLNYIRAVMTQSAGESISGRVGEGRFQGLPQLRVKVTGGGRTWETFTDRDGNFFVSVTGPGVYKVRAEVPFAAFVVREAGGQEVRTNATDTLTTLDYEVTLEKNHCDYQELQIIKDDLHATAEMSGKVLTASGTGLDKGSVCLVKAAKPDDYPTARQLEADGSFAFAGVAPGEYYIVLNPRNEAPDRDAAPYPRTYYPGVSTLEKATKITVAEGAKLEDLNLHLGPPLKPRTISGTVEWANGRKAIGGQINVYDGRNYVQKVTVEQDGTFSFEVYGDFDYQIEAQTWTREKTVISKRIPLTPDKSTGLKLVLPLK